MPESFAEAKAKKWGAPVPGHLRHGSNTYAAKVYGCGCKVCLPSGRRKWKNREDADRPMTHEERQRRLRASKKGTPVPEGTKHGIYTARVYLCKCDVCRAAKAAEFQRKKDRWRTKARGRWTSDGIVDTICWPPRDAGPEWTCPHPIHHQEVA